MGKTDKINISCPSGFPEFLPQEKRLEMYLTDTIRQVFERYGFTPIETPAVERLDVLQAKGNQGDNIIYSLHPVLPPARQAEKEQAGDDSDSSSEARGLKFDQTVPLAAYIARHLNELSFPFARYQMDTVFRGERAKDGRYRQFRQCDIDVVGRGKLSLLYDAQVPAIIAEIFSAINIGEFKIHINNRKVLTGFFAAIGVAEEKIAECVRIIDAADKIGREKVKKALAELNLSEEQINKIIDFTEIDGSPDEILQSLQAMRSQLDNTEVLQTGIEELQTVVKGVRSLGVSEERFCIDLAIARGLDYYTGTVYETTLIGHENLGSICSGGRYDDLVGMFVGEQMPGVGISIGLTRLINRLIRADILHPLSPTPAQVMVLNMQQDLMPLYLEISQKLRQAGLKVITNFEQRAVKKQFQQANKLQVPFCVVIGSEEAANRQCGLKDLTSGEQVDVSLDELPQTIQQKLQLSS